MTISKSLAEKWQYAMSSSKSREKRIILLQRFAQPFPSSSACGLIYSIMDVMSSWEKTKELDKLQSEPKELGASL